MRQLTALLFKFRLINVTRLFLRMSPLIVRFRKNRFSRGLFPGLTRWHRTRRQIRGISENPPSVPVRLIFVMPFQRVTKIMILRIKRLLIRVPCRRRKFVDRVMMVMVWRRPMIWSSPLLFGTDLGGRLRRRRSPRFLFMSR